MSMEGGVVGAHLIVSHTESGRSPPVAHLPVTGSDQSDKMGGFQAADPSINRIHLFTSVGFQHGSQSTLSTLFTIAAVYLLWKRRARRRRSIWVHSILRTRRLHGEYHRLVQELRLDDARFQQYFRLVKTQFDHLLTKVGPRISRLDTSYRRAIGPGERLAICLR